MAASRRSAHGAHVAHRDLMGALVRHGGRAGAVLAVAAALGVVPASGAPGPVEEVPARASERTRTDGVSRSLGLGAREALPDPRPGIPSILGPASPSPEGGSPAPADGAEEPADGRGGKDGAEVQGSTDGVPEEPEATPGASTASDDQERRVDAEPAREPEVARERTSTPEPKESSATSSGGVGVPSGAELRVHDGDLTITKAGTVVDGLDIRGFVRVKAKDVVIRNSIIRGPGAALTAPMSLVQSDAGPGTNLVIEHSEIAASHPSRFVDGIVGMGFTLSKVKIHNVVDQVKIIGDNVTVDGSHLYGNLYYPASGGHDETHDDNVQIAVGDNIRVVNSTLRDSTNAAVMITQDRGSVTNFRFENNRADDGACTVNVAEKAYGPPRGLTIRSNVFGTGQRHERCAIIMTDTTRAAATVSGNTFTDGRSVRVSSGG